MGYKVESGDRFGDLVWVSGADAVRLRPSRMRYARTNLSYQETVDEATHPLWRTDGCWTPEDLLDPKGWIGRGAFIPADEYAPVVTIEGEGEYGL